MKIGNSIYAFCLSFAYCNGQSFQQAVVRPTRKNAPSMRGEMYRRLLSKAKPHQRELANDDANNYDNMNFGVEDYSMKFVKCQGVKQYSDDVAAADDDASSSSGVLSSNKFVIFRFCPTQYCASGDTYGCDSDYGEYILPLDDYLAAMYDFNAEVLANKCEFCADCMDGDRRRRRLDGGDDAAGDDAGGDDAGGDDAAGDDAAGDDAAGDDAAGDDAAGDDAAGDDAAGDDAAVDDAAGDDGAEDDAAAAGDDAAQQDEEEEDEEEEDEEDEDEEQADDQAVDDYDGDCEYYSYCADYENFCDAENDFEDFFGGCTYVESSYGDGSALYFAPACGSGGTSIYIAAYSDDACTELVDNVDISQFTGLNLDDDTMTDYYSQNCFSCTQSKLPWAKAYGADDDGNDDADAEVSQICGDLFDYSAKCNRYYTGYNKDYNGNKYGSNMDVDDEDNVCTFIQNVLTGYDESGAIYISNYDYDKGNSYHTYEFAESSVTLVQLIWMGTALVVCGVLTGYSCYLHRKITRKAPWRPNRGGAASVAGAISRQNSGICMGRSRSTSSASYVNGRLA